MATDTVNIPSFNASIYSELDELAELEADWDQQGGYAIEPAKLDAARRLLHTLEGTISPPNIAPTASGSVDLEWSRDHGRQRLGFYIETPQLIRYLRWHPEQGVQDSGTVAPSDQATLAELVGWFMNGSQPT